MSKPRRKVLHVETLPDSKGFLYIVTTGNHDFYLETVNKGQIHSRVEILRELNTLPQPTHPILVKMALWYLAGECSSFIDLPLDN